MRPFLVISNQCVNIPTLIVWLFSSFVNVSSFLLDLELIMGTDLLRIRPNYRYQIIYFAQKRKMRSICSGSHDALQASNIFLPSSLMVKFQSHKRQKGIFSIPHGKSFFAKTFLWAARENSLFDCFSSNVTKAGNQSDAGLTLLCQELPVLLCRCQKYTISIYQFTYFVLCFVFWLLF